MGNTVFTAEGGMYTRQQGRGRADRGVKGHRFARKGAQTERGLGEGQWEGCVCAMAYTAWHTLGLVGDKRVDAGVRDRARVGPRVQG